VLESLPSELSPLAVLGGEVLERPACPEEDGGTLSAESAEMTRMERADAKVNPD
jgi:hypothetical protein